MTERPTILVIDNFDSFVYNLVQYCEELGAGVVVHRSAEVSVAEVVAGAYAGVLVSPGPGHPRDTPVVLDIIRHCALEGPPVLGVCLGHQALAEAFGGQVVLAPELRHGRSSRVTHRDEGVFEGRSNPLVVGRYHSLVVERATLPDGFVVTADVDGLIMGMRHSVAPLEGVQFHPESVLTQEGYLLLARWLERVGVTGALARASILNEASERRRQTLPSGGN